MNYITDANKKKLLGLLASRPAAGEDSLKKWGREQRPQLLSHQAEEIADALVEDGLATTEERGQGQRIWRAVTRRPEPPPIEVTTRETPGETARTEAPTPTENDVELSELVELSEEAEALSRPAPPKGVAPGSLPVVEVDPDEDGEPQPQADEPAPLPPLSPLARKVLAAVKQGLTIPCKIDKALGVGRGSRLDAVRELVATGKLRRVGDRRATRYVLASAPDAPDVSSPPPVPAARQKVAPKLKADLDEELLARCLAMTPDERAVFVEAWDRATYARSEKLESARREQEAVAAMLGALGRKAA